MASENSVTTPPTQMEPIKLDNLLINFTTEFHRVWDSRGSNSEPGSFWHPTPPPDLLPGYFPLGDLITRGYENINGSTIVAVVCEGDLQGADTSKGKALSPPDDFERVWRDSNSGAAADCTIWLPIPPAGYVALGMVCSNGRDKPSTNTVRCVREDLVIASHISNSIWSDSGSGANQDFSAWMIEPPSASEGQIYFSPGTFVGVNGYARPVTHVAAYSLRMQIPLQVETPPVVPTLSGYQLPAIEETASANQISRLPWFAVKDPDLTPLEQFRTSTFYRLERSDRYVLVGHGHNTDTIGKTFKWTTPRVQTAGSLQALANMTTIRFITEWPRDVSNPRHRVLLLSSPIRFSARLSKRFNHTEASDSGWATSAAVEVVSPVGKKTYVAVYVMQSDYRLVRADRTEIETDICYTDIESLCWAEYPKGQDSEALSPAPENGSPTVTSSEP